MDAIVRFYQVLTETTVPPGSLGTPFWLSWF